MPTPTCQFIDDKDAHHDLDHDGNCQLIDQGTTSSSTPTVTIASYDRQLVDGCQIIAQPTSWNLDLNESPLDHVESTRCLLVPPPTFEFESTLGIESGTGGVGALPESREDMDILLAIENLEYR